jgi:hypothetical protein
MSNEVNLAAPGRVMRNLSGEQARAHERMANLPTRRIVRGPTEAEIQAQREAVTERIQRTYRNSKDRGLV